jgi:spermidine synthase
MTDRIGVTEKPVKGGDHGWNSFTTYIGVIFFLSGFPALLYQLVWQRALFRIFGVNLEAVTIVVTAFLVGLGLGSLAGGFLSKRRGLPVLLTLCVIELLTALFGLFSLAIFDWVGGWTAGMPLWGIGVISLSLVIVPTLLMGATLPLLSEYLAKRSGNTGYSVGFLYYVNTLGAAVACFAGLALLFPFGGMTTAINCAIAFNLVVAVAAFLLHRQKRGEELPAQTPSEETGFHPGVTMHPAVMLLLGALAGFVALSYEIFLFRIMSFMTGGLAPAFAAILGMFLLGIASGSREVSQLARSKPDGIGRVILLQLGIATLVGIALLPGTGWVSSMNKSFGYAAIMLGVFVIARSWGMLLPFLAHQGIRADNNAGQHVSWLYLANIAGSSAGSVLTGFVQMDVLPLTGVARLLALYGAGTIAILYFCLTPRLDQKDKSTGLDAASLQPAYVRMPAVMTGVAAILVMSLMPFDSKVITAQLMLGERTRNAPELVRVHESRSGIITIDAKGEVWGGGMYDGKFSTALFPDRNGARRPYALSLFHPSPKHVLMIGLSTGSWAKIIASHPGVETLTVIEISKGYAELIAERPEVRSILANPKVKLIVDDGRRWLRSNPDRKFDFIVQNTTWHYRANVANLLSQEYLSLVGKGLKQDGVFFFNTTFSARVQRTACVSFPHGFRYHNHMAVSRSMLRPDFKRWKDNLLAYRVDGRHVVDQSNPVHTSGLTWLMSFQNELAKPSIRTQMEPCQSILARTASKALVTDDNMGTEWNYFFNR